MKKPSRSNHVGLDIQANMIAAAEITENRPEIKRAAICEIPTGLVREGEVLNEEELGSAIKAFFIDNKFGRRVRVGVSNQHVVVRTLEVPLLEDSEELDAAIRFKAADHLPFPLEDAVIDYQVTKHHNGNKSQAKIILVAAPKEMIDRILAVVDRAGLKLEGIDLSAFALIRALYRNGVNDAADLDSESEPGKDTTDSKGLDSPEEATGYCHFGTVTNLAIAHGPDCLFARTMSYGIDSMTEELAQRKDITVPDARAWLTHVGLLRDIEVVEGDPEVVREAREVLERGATHLANELQDSLDFYASQQQVSKVTRTLVTGPGALIDGLVPAIDDKIPTSAQVSTPTLKLDHDLSPALLSLAYGLALDKVVA